MISLKELMVDTWVYNSYTNQNMRVYPMMIQQLHRIEKENGSLKDCNIEPIPLTEEILLKCGFVLEDQMYKYFSHKDIPGILQLFDGVAEYSIDSNDLCWVNNIHQLQNLYFILAGEELQIQL